MAVHFKKLFDKTREKLRSEPARRCVWTRVESELTGGFKSRVRVRDFTVVVDQPESFGGGNAGPKPTELLLAALAACQEVTYRLYADALEIPVASVKVVLEGRADVAGFLGVEDGIRPGLQEVRGKVYLESSADAADLARLKTTVERHCPVLDDLRSPVPVSMELVTDTRADGESERTVVSGDSRPG